MIRGIAAAIVILLVIGAGVGLAALASSGSGSDNVAGVTATPSATPDDTGGPSATFDDGASANGASRTATSTAAAGQGGSKTPAPTPAPTPTYAPTAGPTATPTPTATATATDTPIPAPTAPDYATISCSALHDGGSYTVTCNIDGGLSQVGDEAQWYEDDVYIGSDVGPTLVWDIGDFKTHTVFVVIVRAGLSSAPSNVVSGSDTLAWS